MNLKLKRYWFTEPVYDFELKQYQFLALFSEFQKDIDINKIYPWIWYFEQMHKDIISFNQIKNNNIRLRKKDVIKLDLKNQELIYRYSSEITELIEIQAIIDYVIPIIKNTLLNIHQLKQHINASLDCRPVGIISSCPDNGFALINHASGMYAYTYEKSPVYYNNTVSLTPLKKFTYNTSILTSGLKKGLLNSRPEFSPQLWYITGGEGYPLEETLVPLVSEIIYEKI